VERDLDFYEDPSNDDPRFDRASVRSEVLAAIEGRWGDGAIRAMAGSAQRLREDADALERLTERVYATVATTTDRGIRLDLEALLEMPRAFRRRILERAVGRVRDRAGGIEEALRHLEGFFRQPPAKPRIAVASGLEISFEGDHLLVGPSAT
jgi:tRNA(Ile)-lysidine synthase TilS/MesJ